MEMTQDILKELLDYDPHTGVFTWKIRKEEWFKGRSAARICRAWNSTHSGRRAGSVVDWKGNKSKYLRRVIIISHKRYYEHRLAFLWMTGDWPKDQVDHINRDALDNRWANLRDVKRTTNMRNLSLGVNNTSGISGVHWCKKDLRWVAQVTVDRKNNFLGNYLDKEEARKAVENFRKEKGFSEGHGTQRPEREEVVQ